MRVVYHAGQHTPEPDRRGHMRALSVGVRRGPEAAEPAVACDKQPRSPEFQSRLAVLTERLAPFESSFSIKIVPASAGVIKNAV